MIKDQEQIYTEMRDALVSETGLAVSDSGDMAIRLRAFAAQVCSLWVQADWLERQCFPQTAEDTYLDYHAELRGLARLGAAKASGTIRFSVTEPRAADLAISSGVTCLTVGGVGFVTTEGGVIAAGKTSCDVRAEAKEPGDSGNAAVGSVTVMAQSPVGVEACVNPASFTGGRDAESDSDLRARILASYRKLPNGANAAYYETLVLGVEGVAAVSVVPKARGIGTVDIIVADENGVPSDELIAEVERVVNEQREICVSIEVKPPEPVTVDVGVDVWPASGYTFAKAKLDAEAAVRSVFTGRALGKDLLLAKLGYEIFSCGESIMNYKLTSPTADVAVSAYQLPVPGSISITQMAGS